MVKSYLDAHIADNKAQFAVTKETGKINGDNIRKLLPLVALIAPLEEIVENQKANVIVGRKVLRWIGYISAVLGLLWLVVRFWKDIK